MLLQFHALTSIFYSKNVLLLSAQMDKLSTFLQFSKTFHNVKDSIEKPKHKNLVIELFTHFINEIGKNRDANRILDETLLRIEKH